MLKENVMKLIWYGDASLILDDGEQKIAFDPFGNMQFASENASLPFEEHFREVSDIFVTHGHFDHIYHISKLYKNLPVKVYCTKTPRHKMLKKGMKEEQLVEIEPGWTKKAGSFFITAYKGRHCKFDTPLIVKMIFSGRFWRHLFTAIHLLAIHISYKENEETILYEVCHGEKRIQIMGSMNLDADTDYPTGADVLVLPLQGRSDQDTFALTLVERLRPKQIWLDHYDDAFPPLTSSVDVSGFVKNVRERFGIECLPLCKEKIMDIE